MFGMVAMRAPCFTALMRALVWVRDLAVGQRTMSAAAMAAATAAGGSSPETDRSPITMSMASQPSSLAAR